MTTPPDRNDTRRNIGEDDSNVVNVRVWRCAPGDAMRYFDATKETLEAVRMDPAWSKLADTTRAQLVRLHREACRLLAFDGPWPPREFWPADE